MISFRATAVVLATAASLAFSSVATPAQASSSATAPTRSGAAVGLLVHYKPGFEANGFLGALKGQDAVAATGITLGSQHALGHGWHVLKFAGAVSAAAATRALAQMAAQPGVTAVSLDRFIEPAAAPAPKKTSTITATKPAFGLASLLSALKQPPAPLKATLVDAWSGSSPLVAAVQLSWAKPRLATGFKLVGYTVQISTDGGVTNQVYPTKIGPTANSLTLTSGLSVGTMVSMRVAANTLKGKKKVTGRFTGWLSVTPSAVPQSPNFSGGPVSTDSPTITWLALSPSQTGGLPVTYQAVASAPGQTDVTCTSGIASCTFVGLVSGVSYVVKLRAVNARGASPYAQGVEVADPGYAKQWSLNAKYGIHAEQAWKRTTGTGVTVAVLDTGITSHPDLDSQLWTNSDNSPYGYDFVSDATVSSDGDGWDSNPSDPGGPKENGEDHAWHGTHVSGIIAAARNGIGVVGVAPNAKLLEVRVIGDNGGSTADLIAALQWTAGISVPGVPDNLHPAKVVNLSLGNTSYFGCDDATQSTMGTLHDKGVTVVTAAGNDSQAAFDSYPGDCYPTINVGATGFSGDLAYYSNWGLGVDISAPGGDDSVTTLAPAGSGGMIYGTYNDGLGTPGNPSYENLEGTSMAAPVIVGIAALLYSLKPNLTPDQVFTAMRSSVTAWPANSRCAAAAAAQAAAPKNYYIQSCGAGIANAAGAVSYAQINF